MTTVTRRCGFRGTGAIEFLQHGLTAGEQTYDEIYECDPAKCRALADAVKSFQLDANPEAAASLFVDEAGFRQLAPPDRSALTNLRTALTKVMMVRICADQVEYEEMLPRKSAVRAKNAVVRAANAGALPEQMVGLEPPAGLVTAEVRADAK